jgi:Flp pilus assembly pilin Flp
MKHPLRSIAARLRREEGQSTVEYVGLAVAVAVLLASLGGGLGSHGDKIGSAVAKRLTDAIKAQG